MPLKTQAKSSLSNYDLEDLLPRWLQTAYTTSHIQSALTTLDEREDARIKAKSKAAAEAISSHLHSSDSTFDSLESINFYSIASGALPVNQQRNRYMDVLPYDRTRVKIKVPHLGGNPGSVHNHLSGDDESEGLYLNANWVQEKYGKKWWIASQAPLRNTAYTFLSLLLEDMYPPSLSHSATSTSSNPSSHHSRPRTVVQLTQNVESGGRKAHPYFPDVVGQTMIIVPDITDYPSDSDSDHYGDSYDSSSSSSIHRKPKSSRSKTYPAIRFTHLLFVAWPDHSVPSPSDRAALFEFVRLVDRVNRQMPFDDSDVDVDPPIIVGCSAGIGRTGSFIAMNSLLRHAGFLPPPATIYNSHTPVVGPLGPLPTSLSADLVSQEIDSLREQRAGMVQRPEQAVLVYEMMVGAYVERGELKR
ncbi:protein-tyrosine phosphatase-like protein [Lentinula aff. lateritia]|uniref:Protein-tyrosine phosphatase-like protein n=1 Tax=Lentinula aff. lateritia TaxID=2804960 RepID=A0ACC1U9Y3_9AGAR|nr:protein-tyrosine phosphatase-like protein [Lentinula aff. lateritia]